MSTLNYLRRNQDQETDNQTVTQTQTIQQPIVTLQILLNENKMKEIALSKATHLIELYKIELQVKEQDFAKEIQTMRNNERQNYEGLINELEDKIVKLEKQVKIYEEKIKELQKRPIDYPQMSNLQQSGCRIPRLSRNNSGKDLNAQKKHTGRYSQSKNLSSTQGNSMKRSLSNFFPADGPKQHQLYRIQKTFILQYLLRSEEKDEKMLSILQNELMPESQSLGDRLKSIKSNDKFIDQFMKMIKEPIIDFQSKMKQYKQVIKIQELIIQQLNGQLSQYQDLLNVTNASIQEIFSNQNQQHDMRFSMRTSVNSFSKNQQTFEQIRDAIDQIQEESISKVKQHKAFIKQKIQNMENQNKELKRILDDMIKLIKNNKKLQVGGFGGIRNSKTVEEIEPIQERTRSHMLQRK